MEKNIIENKLLSLVTLLEKLKAILKEHDTNKNTNLKEFLLYGAQKKAEEIVELAISINQELLRSKEMLSRSYYHSFIDLEKFNAFSSEDLRFLAGTAGFRNRLAHEYLEVDPTIALRTMKQMMAIYPKYTETILKIIKKKK